MELVPFSRSMISSYPMKGDQSSTNQELSREPKQYVLQVSCFILDEI